MKQTLTTLLLFATVAALAQYQPPVLIYSCELKQNGVSRYEIFNSSGNKIIYNSVERAYSNGLSWLFVGDNKSKLLTVYNYLGQEMGIDSIEESQSTYPDLPRVALKRNGKWGFYNQQGQRRIPHLYDEVSHFSKNIAAVRAGKEIFMIDTNGSRIATPYDPSNKDYTFDDTDIAIGMFDFDYPDLKKITKQGKVGLLDIKNKSMLIPVEYDELLSIKENFKLITAGRNNKYGLVAFGGQILIPLQYESVIVLNDYF